LADADADRVAKDDRMALEAERGKGAPGYPRVLSVLRSPLIRVPVIRAPLMPKG